SDTMPSLAALVPVDARLVVISPHLDDAVLGCGDLLRERPGAVVVTAFAGRPSVYPDLTSWDARAGFEPGADVVGARRHEDEAARRGLLPLPGPGAGAVVGGRRLGCLRARAVLADRSARGSGETLSRGGGDGDPDDRERTTQQPHRLNGFPRRRGDPDLQPT